MTGTLDSAEGRREIWFEVPDQLEPFLSRSGAPWLLAMLPLAVTTGEPIELSLPVDPLFQDNMRALAATWRYWYPELKHVEIRTETERALPAEGRVGQFFSGGVDSWFTLLRHAESTPRSPQVGTVDDLINVWGFDIAIDQPEEFRLLSNIARDAAERYGKRLVVIATNLRENLEGSWKSAWGRGWGALSHGAGLAAVALTLERRYSQVIIASTSTVCEPYPWGTHPLTDTLLSTSATVFRHDHAGYSRTEKIQRLSESDYALSRLKVCTAGTFKNCSCCVKCHRMLLCFDILGILDKATSFDVDLYRANRGRTILIWNENDRSRALEVRDLAVRYGRLEIAELIDQSVIRSRQIKAMTEQVQKVSWRLWRSIYRRLAGDMIGA